jgi:glycosyltransferase involved in cell wall biosynthesis
MLMSEDGQEHATHPKGFAEGGTVYMADSDNPNDSKSKRAPLQSAGVETALRVVMVGNEEALHYYGPVLRRLGVGLIDEVGALSLLSLGASDLLRYVPSPPVRVITEKRGVSQDMPLTDSAIPQTTITAPRWEFTDRLIPRRRVRRLAEVLQKDKPTLLHALSEKQIPLVQALSEELQIPYVASLLALTQDNITLPDLRCGSLLCCNSVLARSLRHGHKYPAERIHLLPIGTHVGKEACCFQHGQRRPVLIYCGPLDYNYGIADLLYTVKRLVKSGWDLNLLLSGQGPDEHKLWDLVVQFKLNQQVHFIPPIDKIVTVSDAYKRVFQDGDIFVQPWPAHRWRPELLEAMSVGNAVVAVNGTQNDLILKEKTALTVDYRDEKQLFTALNRLLEDRAFSQGLAQNAQQHLRKHFLASRMVSRLARAYRQALAL